MTLDLIKCGGTNLHFGSKVARPRDDPAGEDARLVGVLGLLDAVRGHEDRPGECVELLPLVLPGPAVVPDEVGVLPEFRVGVRGEHLRVGVDVYAAARGLLEADEDRPGHVALVGAGPGSEDLLTLRAHRLLQFLDVT